MTKRSFVQREGPLFKRPVTLTAVSNVYTPTIDVADLFKIASPAANFTLAAPTGTPWDGQPMRLRIKMGATGRTITMNAIYVVSGVTSFTAAVLPANKTVSLYFEYDADISKFVLMSADYNGY